MEKIKCRINALLLLFFCFIASFFCTGYKSEDQASNSAERQLKAVFLYNFTQFIEWPEGTFDSESDPFIIGILGEDPYNELIEEVVQGEFFEQHPFEVRYYTSIDEALESHILYIKNLDRSVLRKELGKLNASGILTVGDIPDFGKMGGIIGFVTVGGKIRLQINRQAAEQAGLSISPKLLKLADLIEY